MRMGIFDEYDDGWWVGGFFTGTFVRLCPIHINKCLSGLDKLTTHRQHEDVWNYAVLKQLMPNLIYILQLQGL